MSDGVIRKMCECCGERNCSKEEMQYCKFCGSEDLYTLTEQEDDELERCMDEGFSRHYWKELRRRHVLHSKAFSREEYEARAKAEEKLVGKAESELENHTPIYNEDGSLNIEATLASPPAVEKEVVPVHRPQCPTCHSHNLEKIGAFEKAVSIGMFGFFSNKRKYQFRCKDCGYMW